MSESELEKWSKVHETSVEIQAFLDWLHSEKQVMLCTTEQTMWPWLPHYYPISKKVQDYWMEFNSINPQKLEEERRVLLKEAADASKASRKVTMGIRCKPPPMSNRYFESRFRFLARMWAWFMRRKNYDTHYVVTHLGVTKYLVRARKEVVQ